VTPLAGSATSGRLGTGVSRASSSASAQSQFILGPSERLRSDRNNPRTRSRTVYGGPPAHQRISCVPYLVEHQNEEARDGTHMRQLHDTASSNGAGHVDRVIDDDRGPR
jgi:hypothetical protein